MKIILVVFSFLFFLFNFATATATATATANAMEKDLQRVKQILNQGPCSPQDSFQNCPGEILSYPLFTSASSSSSSNSSPILILDDSMRPASGLLAYASRVLGIYSSSFSSFQESKAILQSEKFSFCVPHKMQEIARILGQARPPLTVQDLRPLGPDLLALMKKVVRAEGSATTTHGTRIFEFLANLNPSASFVLAEFPSPPLSALCSNAPSMRGNRGIKGEELEKFYRQALQELSALIDKYQIRWVNISMAWHWQKLWREIAGNCAGTAAVKNSLQHYLSAKARFLQKLAARHPQTLFIKSAPNDFDSWPSSFDQKINCFGEENIIVVAHISDPHRLVPSHGEDLGEEEIPAPQKYNLACNPLFINSGIDEYLSQHMELDSDWFTAIPYRLRWWKEGGPYENYHGVFDVPLSSMSTSYAAPIALSMIRQAFTPQMPLVQLKRFFAGKVFDPYHNHQLELFELLGGRHDPIEETRE